MAFTYVATQVAANAMMFVRLLIQDTIADRVQLEDEEIAVYLSLRGIAATDAPSTNPSGCYLAAAEAAEALVAVYSRDSSIAITAEGLVKSNAASAYRQLAKDLRARATSGAVVSFEVPSDHTPTDIAGIGVDDDPTTTLDGSDVFA